MILMLLLPLVAAKMLSHKRFEMKEREQLHLSSDLLMMKLRFVHSIYLCAYVRTNAVTHSFLYLSTQEAEKRARSLREIANAKKKTAKELKDDECKTRFGGKFICFRPLNSGY